MIGTLLLHWDAAAEKIKIDATSQKLVFSFQLFQPRLNSKLPQNYLLAPIFWSQLNSKLVITKTLISEIKTSTLNIFNSLHIIS